MLPQKHEVIFTTLEATKQKPQLPSANQSMTGTQPTSPECTRDCSKSGQCESHFESVRKKFFPLVFATAGFKISMGKKCTSAAKTPAIYVGFTSVLPGPALRNKGNFSGSSV